MLIFRLGFAAGSQIIRELKKATTTATATTTSLTKSSRAASNFLALIPFHSIRQMLGIFFWSLVLKDGIEIEEKKLKSLK